MPKEKLIIEKHKEVSSDTKLVFIDSDIHKKVKDLSAETGIPIRQLVNKFVNYAIDVVEIKETGD